MDLMLNMVVSSSTVVTSQETLYIYIYIFPDEYLSKRLQITDLMCLDKTILEHELRDCQKFVLGFYLHTTIV